MEEVINMTVGDKNFEQEVMIRVVAWKTRFRFYVETNSGEIVFERNSAGAIVMMPDQPAETAPQTEVTSQIAAVLEDMYGFSRKQWRIKLSILAAVTVATAVIALLYPRVAQSTGCHRFVDTREWFCVANFANVLSYIPFVFVVLWGFWELGRRYTAPDGKVMYGLLFLGIFLTGFGSAYYHWHPDNDSLVWDRIPMTVVFMSLLAVVVAEWIDWTAGIWLLGPLAILGIFSVLWWHHTEMLGKGDLRLYGWVQFFPVLFIPLAMGLFSL